MLSFDHAVITVMDRLDEAEERYSKLGFTLTPRGFHTLGSINHTIVFSSNNLELLGYAPGEREKRAEMWTYPSGLTGLCMRTADATRLYADMQEAGVPLEALKDFSRPVEIDGVSRDARFRTFQIDRKTTVSGRIFFCQHYTPELIWRDEWQHHANGANNIAAATVIARDPEHVLELMSRVPGLAVGGGEAKCAGSTSLRVTTPDAAEREFAGEGDLPELGDMPMRMVALDIDCESLDRAADLLSGNGIPFRRTAEHISLHPDVALGPILRFVSGA